MIGVRSILLIYFFLLLFIIAFPACKKYLNDKPDSSLQTITTLQDAQELLDNYPQINQYYPGASEILSDDYYATTTDLNGLIDATQRDLYLWQRDSITDNYWTNPYNVIFTTNVVLDALPKINYNPNEQADWNNVKGSALFIRAYYFWGLSELYAKPFNESTAAIDLSIPLRLSSDFNTPSVRASVKEVYSQIINDLQTSIPLLPSKPLAKSRPGKAAVYGALARTYLAMQKYDSAGKYADMCLSISDSLIDYNTLNVSSNIPFTRYNKEVIFQMRSLTMSILSSVRAKIDSTLYNSYNNFDLRKTLFFKANTGVNAGTYLFKGDYDGIGATNAGYAYTGIVTDEMYLIRSESYARTGNISAAMQDLNTLLQNRYTTGHFTPVTATGINDALAKILQERRKELVRRGTRWTDIRRLIGDPQFSIVPKRIINNQSFVMPAPYIVLLPQSAISLSGMPQN